jgi:hypothetical protein
LRGDIAFSLTARFIQEIGGLTLPPKLPGRAAPYFS